MLDAVERPGELVRAGRAPHDRARRRLGGPRGHREPLPGDELGAGAADARVAGVEDDDGRDARDLGRELGDREPALPEHRRVGHHVDAEQHPGAVDRGRRPVPGEVHPQRAAGLDPAPRLVERAGDLLAAGVAQQRDLVRRHAARVNGPVVEQRGTAARIRHVGDERVALDADDDRGVGGGARAGAQRLVEVRGGEGSGREDREYARDYPITGPTRARSGQRGPARPRGRPSAPPGARSRPRRPPARPRGRGVPGR